MTTDVFDITADNILEAKSPEAVFGDLGNTSIVQIDALKGHYRRISRIVHPDKALDKNKDKANKAFAHLSELLHLAQKAIDEGKYGQKISASTLTITSKSHTYDVFDPISAVGVADYYNCLIDARKEGILAISHLPKDNDLMANEVKILKHLTKDAPDAFAKMLPKLVETLTYNEAGVHRTVNAFEAFDPKYVTLAEVLAAYPKGLHTKDMAWIWRRLLDILGYIHAKGVVHGNIVPSNILIGLDNLHDVTLINFQGSVRDDGGNIPIINSTYKTWYPSEVLKKEKPDTSTDIFMSAKCMMALIGMNPITNAAEDVAFTIHPRHRGFLLSCVLEPQARRPHNCWSLRSEFTQMIDSLWGTREYRPLHLPK